MISNDRYRRRLSSLTFVAFTLAALLATPVAHAAFPGRNGKIVFSSDRDGDSEIYVTTVAPRSGMFDGESGFTRLTRNRASDYGPAWSPGGRRVAFVSDRDGDDEIYVMRADGRGVRQLTHNRDARDAAPAWSPDGARIVFTSDRDGGEPEIYAMRVNGTAQTRITKTRAAEYTPVWSPDGAWIAFASDRDGVDVNTALYRMRPNGRQVAPLTVSNGGATFWNDAAPAWSPEGTRIAFASDRDGDQELYVMASDGSDLQQLTHNSDRDDVFPEWAPDGSAIAFSTFGNSPGEADGNVYLATVDGSVIRRLTLSSADDSSPDWQARYTVRGTAVADVLAGAAGHDLAGLFAGDDAFRGFVGNDVVFAGLGNDRLYGGKGKDVLVGGAGRDRLVGGAGDDLLYGRDGAGNDVLRGGAGNDICIGDRGDRTIGCERR